MTQVSDEQKAIATAIFDPGSIVGMKGDRTLTEWQVDAVMASLQSLHANADAEADAGLLAQVTVCVKEYAENGFWRTCSGCHESEDGYDVGHYPHSKAFDCKLGSGCSECGGIGAVWDTTDYAAMGEALSAPASSDEIDVAEELYDSLLPLMQVDAPDVYGCKVKAQALILSTIASIQEPVAVTDDFVHAAKFLIERLDDFERDALQEDDGEYVLRQFGGHVSPAIERLRDALSQTQGE